jgi:hypothetical protein
MAAIQTSGAGTTGSSMLLIPSNRAKPPTENMSRKRDRQAESVEDAPGQWQRNDAPPPRRQLSMPKGTPYGMANRLRMAAQGHSLEGFDYQHALLSNQLVVAEMESKRTLQPIVERGQIRLGTLYKRVDEDDKDEVQSFTLDFDGFRGTRLAALMDLYERWKVLDAHFEYIPTVAAVTPGTVIIAPEYDPCDIADGVGDEMATRLMQYAHAREGAVSSTFKTKMPPLLRGVDVADALWTAPVLNPRQCSYGKARCMVMGATESENGEAVGYLLWHYEIRLFIPQIDSVKRYLGSASTLVRSILVTPAGANTKYSISSVPRGHASNPRMGNTAGDQDITAAGGSILRGILNGVVGALGLIRLYTANDIEVKEGTPIWIEVAEGIQSDIDKAINLSTVTQYIQHMWYGGIGDKGANSLRLAGSIAGACAVALRDVFYWGPKSGFSP